MANFFVSCPLGYEEALAKELKTFWFEMIDLDGLPTRTEFPEIEIIEGGLQLSASEHLGFQINFFSKLANRVLLRISKFEARYFDQFEKNFSKIEFEKYLATPDVKIKVESHKSRLNNDKNIIEAATHVFNKKKFFIKNESQNTIYIRFEKDWVTISLDTSGEHLHRRGYAVYRGEAPLRETLAAYLIRKLHRFAVGDNLNIVDPFVGSGTILFEALSYDVPNFERDYAWLHLKNSPKLFKSDSWKKNYRWFNKENRVQGFGFDIDEKSLVNLEKNKIEFAKIYPQIKFKIETVLQDSHQLDLSTHGLKKNVWLVTNPPYGIRLADDNAKYILEKLEDQVDGIIVIHPSHWKFNFKKVKNILTEDFSNQGLNLKLSVYIKNI